METPEHQLLIPAPVTCSTEAKSPILAVGSQGDGAQWLRRSSPGPVGGKPAAGRGREGLEGEGPGHEHPTPSVAPVNPVGFWACGFALCGSVAGSGEIFPELTSVPWGPLFEPSMAAHHKTPGYLQAEPAFRIRPHLPSPASLCASLGSGSPASLLGRSALPACSALPYHALWKPSRRFRVD